MKLRLIPPNKKSQDPPAGPPQNKNKNLLIIIFILLIVPLLMYHEISDRWGHEMGTHFAFFTGACCVFLASGLIYFAGFLDE